VDYAAVELRLVHVGDGGLGIGLGEVEDVGGAAIRAGLPVDREIQIDDVAVLAEDLVQVFFVDILGQALDDNLGGLDLGAPAARATA